MDGNPVSSWIQNYASSGLVIDDSKGDPTNALQIYTQQTGNDHQKFYMDLSVSFSQ